MLLALAVRLGFPCYPVFAEDAHLDALRREPAFIALLATLEDSWLQRTRSL